MQLIRRTIGYLLLSLCLNESVMANEHASGRNIILIDSARHIDGECGVFNDTLNSVMERGTTENQVVIFFPALDSKSPYSAEILSSLSSWIKPHDNVRYLAIENVEAIQTIGLIQQEIKDSLVDFSIELFTSIDRSLVSSSILDATQLKIKKTSCVDPNEGEFSKTAVTRKTRRLIAEYLNAPLSMVQVNTNIFNELGVGQTLFYELSLYLTDAFGVMPIPNEQRISLVSQLISYIQDADDQIIQRGIEDKKESYIQTVYFGTNREKTNSNKPSLMYSGKRTGKLQINYGSVDVSIPKTHRTGAMESAFLGMEVFTNPKEHIFAKAVNPLSKHNFNKSIEEIISKDSDNALSNDAIVFIHGFNVSFENAARRTAQIAYDINFTGAPLFFSWPSDAKLTGYMSDREDAIWSAAYIESFLNNLISLENVDNIHIISHSMGNQALIGALHRIALKQHNKKQLFKNIILAAPDFDAGLFEQQIANDVRHLSDSWTIYASDNDSALNFSTELNNAVRLGLPITPLSGMNVIDATGIEVSPWNVPEFHSYYATKSKVINDIVAVISGRKVSERALDKKIPINGVLPYWKLK